MHENEFDINEPLVEKLLDQQIPEFAGLKLNQIKPLATQNDEVRKAILNLKDMFDSDIITSIWEECLNVPNWDKLSLWIHGDLLPSNLLIHNGKLNSVIDFGMMGIGDPACDLIPAWCLFDADSREVFRKELQIDDDTWIRGKGWALAIALTIIPYYLYTNPVLVSVAKTIIYELIGDKNNDKK
jgi:aminoglycoside phosphotransferase (APT) family kinase protein